MSETIRTYKPKKVNYINQFKAALAEYKKVLFVNADNVGSSQLAQIRMDLRNADSTLLMGKNTLMKQAIKQYAPKNPKVKLMNDIIVGNCGCIFTNGNLKDIKDLVTSRKVEASAKAGSISPVKVVIKSQNTGMEPTKTSFFQALDIPTKITRGTVEIINDTVLLNIGDKVGKSEAQLLTILGIKPFKYGLTPFSVYDDGSVYDPEVLDLTDDDLLNSFYDATAQLAALSMELDLVNEATVPHSLANSFKDLLCIAVETDYSFKQAEKVKEFLKDPSKFVKVEEKKEEKGEEKKEEEPEEEEESEEGNMGGGLFGGDDDEEDEDDDDEDDDDEDDDDDDDDDN